MSPTSYIKLEQGKYALEIAIKDSRNEQTLKELTIPINVSYEDSLEILIHDDRIKEDLSFSVVGL